MFACYETLADLMAQQHVNVEDWVHVFYAIVFVGPERRSIHFMLDGKMHMWSRETLS